MLYDKNNIIFQTQHIRNIDFFSLQITILLYHASQVIYERLGDSQQFRDLTLRHLEDFAGEGLRTLCYAVAEISPEYYEVRETESR